MIRKNKPANRPRPVVLAILEGWGINKDYEGNAISRARTPVIDDLIVRYPATALTPAVEPGAGDEDNRRSGIIGHRVIGTGRNYETNFTRINREIKNRGFYKNEVLLNTIRHAVKYNSKLHLLSLLEDGGRDGSIDHLFAVLKLVKKEKAGRVCLHVFLDGRNSPDKSGLRFIKRLEHKLSRERLGEIATIAGRLYALDRNKNWERTRKAYNAMTIGEGNIARSAASAVEESYKNKIFDEEFPPTVIYKHQVPAGIIEDNDAVIFLNLNSQSARQLSRTFTKRQFNKFKRLKTYKHLFYTTFIKCENDLSANIAFPEEAELTSISEAVFENGLKQLKICEISRLGRLTYFFNGLREERFNNEDIIVIPKAAKSSYKYSPENNIKSTTNHALRAISGDNYDFLAVNYPDIDIAAHTGDVNLTVNIAEILDSYIKILAKSVLDKQGVLILTSDHGNAEAMLDLKTEEIKTKHSNNCLPLIIIGNNYEGRSLSLGDTAGCDLSLVSPKGGLADIAPTILEIMQIPKPNNITGKNLFNI